MEIKFSNKQEEFSLMQQACVQWTKEQFNSHSTLFSHALH